MPFRNDLLTMMCCLGNTFMSHNSINKNAEVSQLERRTSAIVARHAHDGSGRNPVPRLRHLSAPRTTSHSYAECSPGPGGMSKMQLCPISDINSQAYRYLKDARAIGRDWFTEDEHEFRELVERRLLVKRPKVAFATMRFHVEKLESPPLFRLMKGHYNDLVRGRCDPPLQFIRDRQKIRDAGQPR